MKHTANFFIIPWLFCFLALVCCQLCICSLPCLYSKGCCCFKKCNGYKKKGTVTETRDVYVLYKDYIKFGLDISNPMIIEESKRYMQEVGINQNTDDNDNASGFEHDNSGVILMPVHRSGTLQGRILKPRMQEDLDV